MDQRGGDGMPTSLIVVALVLAWLVVLVPIIVRKRQETAKTAESTLVDGEVRDTRDEGHEEDTMGEDSNQADDAPVAHPMRSRTAEASLPRERMVSTRLATG